MKHFYDSDMPDDPHDECREEIKRLEVELASVRNEIESVLMLMDDHVTIWGDESTHRTCRDRLRKLIPADTKVGE